MKKKFITIITYILIFFNSHLASNENNNVLKVGLLAPLSGEYKELGDSLLYSLQLALNEINDKDVYIIPRDSGSGDSKKLNKAISENTINSILIKLNQIGTVSETIETINLAKNNNYNFIISHRSGETEDTFIADFSVAMGGGQIKTGSVCRTDRTSKYNQLLRIEEKLSPHRFGKKFSFIK